MHPKFRCPVCGHVNFLTECISYRVSSKGSLRILRTDCVQCEEICEIQYYNYEFEIAIVGVSLVKDGYLTYAESCTQSLWYRGQLRPLVC